MSKSLLRQHLRYRVTYEDEDCIKVMTFAVVATSASVAIARVIGFIDENKLQVDDNPYYLIPRISKEKADFEII